MTGYKFHLKAIMHQGLDKGPLNIRIISPQSKRLLFTETESYFISEEENAGLQEECWSVHTHMVSLSVVCSSLWPCGLKLKALHYMGFPRQNTGWLPSELQGLAMSIISA